MTLKSMMGLFGLFVAMTLETDPAIAGQVAMRDVRSWGYQLQGHPRAVSSNGVDLLVVDYSSDGSHKCVLTAAEVAALKKRAGEPDRIVLAYLSIGEAEDYRYYWDASWITRSVPEPPERPDLPCNTSSPEWTAYGKIRHTVAIELTDRAPSWLGNENPSWRGNFQVRYWDPAWQAILFGSQTAYLDRILAAGFDGVYLDRVDAFDEWQQGRPQAPREMTTLVKRIAAYAREKRPGFLVVPQNAEALLKYDDYIATIDGIAKEDLLYGLDGKRDGSPNPQGEVWSSRRMLDRARRAGKTVLAVEYVRDPGLAARVTGELRGLGYVPLVAPRELDEAPSGLATAPSQSE